MYNYDETKAYDKIKVEDVLDEIEGVPEDADVAYEVWAIGYDNDNEVTDAELLLKTFKDPDEAVTYAKGVELADVIQLDNSKSLPAAEVAYINIEVETVVDDEDGGTMNVGTIFYKHIVF
jgi:hypothetical protein